MDEEARRKLRIYLFVTALLTAEYQATVIAIALSYCGIGWDGQSGKFRKV